MKARRTSITIVPWSQGNRLHPGAVDARFRLMLIRSSGVRCLTPVSDTQPEVLRPKSRPDQTPGLHELATPGGESPASFRGSPCARRGSRPSLMKPPRLGTHSGSRILAARPSPRYHLCRISGQPCAGMRLRGQGRQTAPTSSGEKSQQSVQVPGLPSFGRHGMRSALVLGTTCVQ